MNDPNPGIHRKQTPNSVTVMIYDAVTNTAERSCGGARRRMSPSEPMSSLCRAVNSRHHPPLHLHHRQIQQQQQPASIPQRHPQANTQTHTHNN